MSGRILLWFEIELKRNKLTIEFDWCCQFWPQFYFKTFPDWLTGWKQARALDDSFVCRYDILPSCFAINCVLTEECHVDRHVPASINVPNCQGKYLKHRNRILVEFLWRYESFCVLNSHSVFACVVNTNPAATAETLSYWIFLSNKLRQKSLVAHIISCLRLLPIISKRLKFYGKNDSFIGKMIQWWLTWGSYTKI